MVQPGMDPLENETLRWPTNLDRAGIQERLVKVRDAGKGNPELSRLAELFADVESMRGPQIGVKVISALTWLEDKPQHRAIIMQLEMVAMNLKNLKPGD